MLFTGLVVPVTDGPGTRGQETVTEMGSLQHQRELSHQEGALQNKSGGIGCAYSAIVKRLLNVQGLRFKSQHGYVWVTEERDRQRQRETGGR